MTTKAKRDRFIEMAEQITACAKAQKDWDDDTFQRCFNCTKDQALLNNIKVFNQAFSAINE